jgi:hypothetical protein
MAIILKLKAYLIALGGFILAIAGTYLWGRFKGSEKAKTVDQVEEAKAQTEAIQQQAQTRKEVDDSVSKLPKPTVPDPLPEAQGQPSEAVQVVATADPSTAAGELRKDFMR